jgi:hypothetical protein
LKVNAMTEYQKVATGLLGLTHPEIFRPVRYKPDNPAHAVSSMPAPDSTPELDPTPARALGPSARQAGALISAVKFAFAALMAGSRAVPLGDNGQLTKDLVAYAVRLRH